MAADSGLNDELKGIETRLAEATKANDTAKIAEYEAEGAAFCEKVARMRTLATVDEIKTLFPKLKDLDPAALERVLANASETTRRVKRDVCSTIWSTTFAKLRCSWM